MVLRKYQLTEAKRTTVEAEGIQQLFPVSQGPINWSLYLTVESIELSELQNFPLGQTVTLAAGTYSFTGAAGDNCWVRQAGKAAGTALLSWVGVNHQP